ncbi:MAG TPA: hypothetical protein VFX89_15010 [Gammaproteobacteria bacterium]|nr:hypothetical protein [Gammaproteobacteria bacterium]
MPAGLLEAMWTRALYALFPHDSGLFAQCHVRRGARRERPSVTNDNRASTVLRIEAIIRRRFAFSCTVAGARLAGDSPPKDTRVSMTLYAGNLPLSATAETLASKFGKFGTVISVTLDRDAATGVSRRGAFVEMLNAVEAKRAIEGLNYMSFDGRLMSVFKAVAAVQSVSK